MPEPGPIGTGPGLDRVVEDQALAVLAAIDDLRHDLPGSVHDARVALRKLRSTLIIFRPLLDRPAARRLDHELRWFGAELGAARDAQVVRSRITTALRAGDAGEAGEVLLAHLDQTIGSTWDRARSALEGPRTKALAVSLEQVALRSIVAADATDAAAIGLLGSGLEDLLARAGRLVQDSATVPDEALHRLRKRIKRLRFALASVSEPSVRVLPAGSGAGRLAHALEDLQDLLGEHQDAVVTAAVLERLGAQGAPASAAVANHLAATQRRLAQAVRDQLPGAVKRVRRADGRLQRRTRRVSGDGRVRPPRVHLDPP